MQHGSLVFPVFALVMWVQVCRAQETNNVFKVQLEDKISIKCSLKEVSDCSHRDEGHFNCRVLMFELSVTNQTDRMVCFANEYTPTPTNCITEDLTKELAVYSVSYVSLVSNRAELRILQFDQVFLDQIPPFCEKILSFHCHVSIPSAIINEQIRFSSFFFVNPQLYAPEQAYKSVAPFNWSGFLNDSTHLISNSLSHD